jgi:kumamolisin
MPNEPLVPLPGSERDPLPRAVEAGPPSATARAELTVVLRRQAPGALGASAADVELARSVFSGLGLTVTSVHTASRRVKVSGTVAELAAAFGTSVRMVSSGGVTHRYRVGRLFVPQSLDGVVTAVLGLDDRPQARAHFRTRATTPAAQAPAAPAPTAQTPAAPAPPAPAAPPTYTPNQVATAYGFPAGMDGTGQIVALVELGGGYSTSDLSTYFQGLGIPVPSVTAESVDGVANAPGSDPGGADVEVSLDVEVVGAAAPGAKQLVYFAPNSDQGFVDSVSDAAHATPAPVAISISWGQSEDAWTAQGRTALDDAIADACALGITVCVAAGDNGSSDGATDGKAHVDFPASSPHALACGGTRLVVSGGSITSETVWNDGAGGGAGGGGVSDAFPLPSWQATAGVPASANAASTGPAAGTGARTDGTTRPAAAGGATRPAAGTDAGAGTRAVSVTRNLGETAMKAVETVAKAAVAEVRHRTTSTPPGWRGVPDVAGNADPDTGYQIMADGQMEVVGGTSAVAPLWAALIARLAQATGKRFGLIQPALYAGVKPGTDVQGFNDVVSGNNGAYSAGPGWDACTGLGSPDGPTLLARLQA